MGTCTAWFNRRHKLFGPWLRVERVLGEMGIPNDSAAGRRHFERMMEERRT